MSLLYDFLPRKVVSLFSPNLMLIGIIIFSDIMLYLADVLLMVAGNCVSE